MRPAFSSTKQAAAFALLLLGLLLLPVLGARFGLLSREEAYATMPTSAGPFSFMRQQIFEEKSDVDIAFIGSSVILFGIDTPQVQRELSTRLGREARVITLAGLWAAEDRNYLVLHDLLQHRKVKMVVLCMEQECSHYFDEPYVLTYRFFPVEEDSAALNGLSFRWRAAFYTERVLGMPRHLLSVLLPPLKETPPETADLGMWRQPFWDKSPRSTFVPFTPPPPSLPPQAMIYSPTTEASFRFGNEAMDEFQTHFVRKMGELIREHGVQLVILDIPPQLRDDTVRVAKMKLPIWASLKNPAQPRLNVVEEFSDWPDVFGVPLDMAGVPTASLFKSLTDEQVKKLYTDDTHFNINGNAFFTHTITPALLELYDQEIHR